MSITAEQALALKKAVRQLVRAEVASSWKGSNTDELDRQLIDEEPVACRIRLGGIIKRLTDAKLDEPYLKEQT